MKIEYISAWRAGGCEGAFRLSNMSDATEFPSGNDLNLFRNSFSYYEYEKKFMFYV